MKLGITGLPGSGKMTVFEALTGDIMGASGKGEDRIGTIRVPDSRVDVLSEMYKPRKTIYAQVEYFLPAAGGKAVGSDHSAWTGIRDCDALLHVVRNFGGYGYDAPQPGDDFRSLDQEMILADLMVVEKRVERLNLDKKRGKAINMEELSLLSLCLEKLETETPLRKIPEAASSSLLKGYGLLSAKPTLVLYNNEDDDDHIPSVKGSIEGEKAMVIRGKLEHELAQMSDREAEEFLREFDISASATDRVIAASYSLLGLISFFTTGSDEVRAWTIRKNTIAMDAAGVIHSDMKKGFIRAEVLAYDDLMSCGTFQEAKKQGKARLEGKTYTVCDGDLITFRFNV